MGEIGEGRGVISILSLRPQFKEGSFVFLTEFPSNAGMNSFGEERMCRLALSLGNLNEILHPRTQDTWCRFLFPSLASQSCALPRELLYQ